MEDQRDPRHRLKSMTSLEDYSPKSALSNLLATGTSKRVSAKVGTLNNLDATEIATFTEAARSLTNLNEKPTQGNAAGSLPYVKLLAKAVVNAFKRKKGETAFHVTLEAIQEKPEKKDSPATGGNIPSATSIQQAPTAFGQSTVTQSLRNHASGFELMSRFKKTSPKNIKAVPNPLKEENAPNTYKYSSNNSYSLLYIPEDYLKLQTTKASDLNDDGFKSFNELFKINKKKAKKLDELILEQERVRMSQNSNSRAPSRESTKGGETLNLIKKQLDYNKQQEKLYINKVDDYLKQLYIPLREKSKEQEHKLALMPKIKVFPSRKSLYLKHNSYESKDSDVGFNSITPLPKSEIEEKPKSDNMNEMSALLGYKFFWHESYESSKWRPDVREGATFTAVGKMVVLYGGISNTILEDICIFDPIRQTWTKPECMGDVPFFGRHGHTACEFRKLVIIFGGEKKFNNTMKLRECLNDTRAFNPEMNEWKYYKCIGKILEPRRNHAAAMYDRSLVVYGGINNHGHLMKDVWMLNFKNNSWNEIMVENTEREIGLAYHTLTAVFIDRNSAMRDRSDRPKIAHEGYYCFGGKDANNKTLNRCKVLKFDNKQYSWVYPTITGIPPTARFKHVAVYYEPLSLLIIHGGRNDSLYEANGSFCLSDIKVLNLEKMQWSNCSVHGLQTNPLRCSHATALFGNNLLIFGGLNGNEYSNSEVKFLELNQSLAKKMIKESGSKVDEELNENRFGSWLETKGNPDKLADKFSEKERDKDKDKEKEKERDKDKDKNKDKDKDKDRDSDKDKQKDKEKEKEKKRVKIQSYDANAAPKIEETDASNKNTILKDKIKSLFSSKTPAISIRKSPDSLTKIPKIAQR